MPRNGSNKSSTGTASSYTNNETEASSNNGPSNPNELIPNTVTPGPNSSTKKPKHSKKKVQNQDSNDVSKGLVQHYARAEQNVQNFRELLTLPVFDPSSRPTSPAPEPSPQPAERLPNQPSKSRFADGLVETFDFDSSESEQENNGRKAQQQARLKRAKHRAVTKSKRLTNADFAILAEEKRKLRGHASNPNSSLPNDDTDSTVGRRLSPDTFRAVFGEDDSSIEPSTDGPQLGQDEQDNYAGESGEEQHQPSSQDDEGAPQAHFSPVYDSNNEDDGSRGTDQYQQHNSEAYSEVQSVIPQTSGQKRRRDSRDRSNGPVTRRHSNTRYEPTQQPHQRYRSQSDDYIQHRERERAQYPHSGRNQNRSPDHPRRDSRERDQDRGRGQERERERDRERDWERDRDHARGRGHDGSRDRRRNSSRDRRPPSQQGTLSHQPYRDQPYRTPMSERRRERSPERTLDFQLARRLWAAENKHRNRNRSPPT